MKKITSIIVFALLIISASAVQAQNQPKILEEKIKVGFHCPNGKNLLEKELIKTPGVTEVYADLETKIVTIKFEEGKTNKDELVKAIEKIGYTTEYTKPGTKINKACSHD